MENTGFWDFMIEGGDELLNSELCLHCGDVIYLDQKIEWIDEDKKIAKCPSCGVEVKIT
jgi:NAD-dependent SIR2 family protein deacetylase